MIGNVPFLAVNICCLASFTLIFVALISSRITRPIRSFLVLMVGFMIWEGGAVLMRFRVVPGVPFWYHVSVMALFSLCFLIYLFLCEFLSVKGSFLKTIFGVTNVILLVFTALDVFLDPPSVINDGGKILFSYTIKWQVAFPFAYFICIVIATAVIFKDHLKRHGLHTPGLMAMLLGTVSVILGNLLQILPGNTFPWDAVSGIVFAALLMYALYQKHMFRLTLNVSRRLVQFLISAILVAWVIVIYDAADAWFQKVTHFSEKTVQAIILFLFAAMIAMAILLVGKIIDVLYTRERKMGAILKEFSDEASLHMDAQGILESMMDIIRRETAAEQVILCLPDASGTFVPRAFSGKLRAFEFAIRKDCPLITYLNQQEKVLTIRDFYASAYSIAMRDDERDLIRQLKLDCVIPMKKESRTIGLALLLSENGSHVSHSDIDFISALASVGSIAVDNSVMYEKIFREARIDSLTGAWNYTHFSEKLNELYAEYGDSALALTLVDLDDLKLYNQIYGRKEGDIALIKAAEIIKKCAGKSDLVFRTDGKTFAILQPGVDGRTAFRKANEISKKIHEMNDYTDGRLKPLSSSIGICVSPYTANNPQELLDNADFAVFSSVNKGKGSVTLYRYQDAYTGGYAERAGQIIERVLNHADSELKKTLTMVYSLTAAIDAKDHYTCSHSQSVARYASILALRAGLNEDQVAMTYEAGLLHDLGKISIPEVILNKAGKLTDEEYDIIKTHVDNSIEMIRYLPYMEYLVPFVVGHHERWDGKGYPRGLKGEENPIQGRILAVVDAFDAMTSDRPYRKGMPVEEAVRRLRESAGTQFDSVLVDFFVELIDQGEIKLTSQNPSFGMVNVF